MRHQILLASSVGAIAIAIAAPALAADLGTRPPPPVFVPPPPIFTWTGLYMGGQIGYVWGSDPIDEVNTAVGGQNAFFNTKPSGVIGGAHVGYNLQIAQWVVGLEGSVDGTGIDATRSSSGVPLVVTMTTQAAVQGSIRARLGVAFDRVLIYGTGGAAFAGITDPYTVRGPGALFLQESDSKTRTGWTVGGGLEYALTNNWSIGAEYRYSDFGRSSDFPFPTLTLGNVSFTHHLTENQVQARFSYKFGAAPAPVVAKY